MNESFKVQVVVRKWVEAPEGPFEAFINLLLHKPQRKVYVDTNIEVTCGMEAKVNQDGTPYFTLWMSKEEVEPLQRAGLSVPVLLLPISRGYTLDVLAEGLKYEPVVTVGSPEAIEFQSELVPDSGQSLLFKLADD